MTITLRTHGIALDDELRQMVERRLGFALDRYRNRLADVEVYLADLNGPRGGVDKLCQITASVAGGGPVFVLERSPRIEQAVNSAARRLSYRIGRRIERRWHPAARRLATGGVLCSDA